MKGKEINHSYYKLYLMRYLRDIGNPSYKDSDFVSARVDAAMDEYERMRLGGADVHQAQESSLAILLEGFEEG